MAARRAAIGSDRRAGSAVGSPTPHLIGVTAEVRRIGALLERRGKAVRRRTAERIPETELSPHLLRRFERFNASSTAALGRWLAGESTSVARAAGRDTWQFYGEMSARYEVSLYEIMRRGLAWRDAVAETIGEIALELEVSPQALEHALQTLHLSLEHSLVRIARAIDAERERVAHELAFMTTHDRLTGLANRSLIVERTEQMLARARRHGTPVAALVLGLENLRSIGETLGHERAEVLLRALAERLDGCVRDTDTLGRLGEEEFAVIVEGRTAEEGPLALAERLREALAEPFALAEDAGRVTVSSCIGVAIGARSCAEALISDAETAMHHATWEGRHGVAVFDPGMEHAARRRLELEGDLRGALAQGELALAYQPIVAIAGMEVVGVEALLRWNHPSRGAVSPSTFIPLLEGDELIVEVGGWVLQEACRFAAGCRDGGRPIEIAVNVSGRQLDDDELLAQVREALARTGLAATSLTLELTETTLMRNVDAAARTLCALRELGVRIAIDDFGTGYSSLSHLQRLPVDQLKIDRSFVCRIDREGEDATLVQTMLQLGRALSIETVAEGIESLGQMAMLRAAGCDRGQGFLLARPLDGAVAEAFLRSPDLAVGGDAAIATLPSA